MIVKLKSFMLFKQEVDKLAESKEFKDWTGKHKAFYLAYGFLSFGEKSEWQIGYYNKNTDKITSFTIGDSIVTNPEENGFKEEHHVVKELLLDKLKINLDQALSIAEKLQKEKYKNDPPLKKILIIQNLDIGQVWNITFVTATLKTLNVKVDSETGEVLEHKADSILDFAKQDEHNDDR